MVSLGVRLMNKAEFQEIMREENRRQSRRAVKIVGCLFAFALFLIGLIVAVDTYDRLNDPTLPRQRMLEQAEKNRP